MRATIGGHHCRFIVAEGARKPHDPGGHPAGPVCTLTTPSLSTSRNGSTCGVGGGFERWDSLPARVVPTTIAARPRPRGYATFFILGWSRSATHPAEEAAAPPITKSVALSAPAHSSTFGVRTICAQASAR
jgi:hypothetical protein